MLFTHPATRRADDGQPVRHAPVGGEHRRSGAARSCSRWSRSRPRPTRSTRSATTSSSASINGRLLVANGVAEFRVKRAGGPIDDKAPVAKSRSVRRARSTVTSRAWSSCGSCSIRQAGRPRPSRRWSFDLADPVGRASPAGWRCRSSAYRYYGFYCGVDFWGGYWFGGGAQSVTTADGSGRDRLPQQHEKASTLEPDAGVPGPARHQRAQGRRGATCRAGRDNGRAGTAWSPIPAAPSGFYLARRDYLGEVKMGTSTFSRYKYFAQRYETGTGALAQGPASTCRARSRAPGSTRRRALVHDQRLDLPDAQFPDRAEWHGDTRLNLLKQRQRPPS